MTFFYKLFITCIFSAISVQAQTTLTGTVRDAAGKPLEGILFEAETKTQPPATAFVISGADGSFTLRLAATPVSDSLLFSARALGYAAQLLRLPNRSQTVILNLRAEETKLREVVVQGAPISRQGDTLSYAVAAFANKQDRVISDVLKKMPGIEVAGDGQISYEGRPISSFNINGQNLLEGRYTMASATCPPTPCRAYRCWSGISPSRRSMAASGPRRQH